MLLMLAAFAQAAALAAGLDLRWQVPLEPPPAAPAAYDASTAYIPLRDGQLVAVDLERGSIRWRREAATTLAPATGGGLVFLAADGAVLALAGSSGRVHWQSPMPAALVSVAFDNGWLLCSTAEGTLVALRAADGAPMWRASLGAPPVVPPAAGLDRLYLGLDGGTVVSLELATGRQVWARTLAGRVTGLTAVDGQLIVGTTGNAAYSLDLDHGRQRWRWRVGGDVAGPATSDDRHVYFAARDNVLRAVDLGNGNLRWSAELGSRPVGGPQVSGGVVLVPLPTAVALFDPATGKSAGTIAASGEMGGAPHLRLDARPTGARLVAATRDGRLQGFGMRVEEPPAPLDGLPGVPVVP